LIDNPNYQDFATGDDSAYPELWDGCVGAWAPCLGPTGLRLHDMGGRANWGTLTNMDAATDWVVDGGKYALDFDGVNDYVNIGDLTAFNRSTYSVSMWFKSFSASPTATPIFWIGNSGNVPDLVIFPNRNGTIQIYIPDQIVNAGIAHGGVWNHVVIVRSGASGGLYVNGVLVANITSIGNSLLQPVFYIGGFPLGSTYHNGMADDVRAFNRILTLADAQFYYAGGYGRGIAYTPRRRRKAYFGQQFNAAWARGSNQFIQPSLIGVA